MRLAVAVLRYKEFLSNVFNKKHVMKRNNSNFAANGG